MCVEIGSAARGTDSTVELPPGSLLVDSRTLRVDWCLSVLGGGEVGKVYIIISVNSRLCVLYGMSHLLGAGGIWCVRAPYVTLRV